jgi:hypothetical protein
MLISGEILLGKRHNEVLSGHSNPEQAALNDLTMQLHHRLTVTDFIA